MGVITLNVSILAMFALFKRQTGVEDDLFNVFVVSVRARNTNAEIRNRS